MKKLESIIILSKEKLKAIEYPNLVNLGKI